MIALPAVVVSLLFMVCAVLAPAFAILLGWPAIVAAVLVVVYEVWHVARH